MILMNHVERIPMKKLKQFLTTCALYLLSALAICLAFFAAIQALYVGLLGMFVLACVAGVAYLYYRSQQHDP